MAKRSAVANRRYQITAPTPDPRNWRATIACIPADGAHAFERALVERFGSTRPDVQYRKDHFGNTVQMGAQTIEVNTRQGRVSIPWGRVKAGDFPHTFVTDSEFENGRIVFEVTSSYTNEEEHKTLNRVLARAEELVRIESLYRGHAIKLLPTPGSFISPEFLDVSGYTEDKLIFPEATQSLLNQTLFYPLRNAAACRQRRVSLKRGLLLGGKWGTGKTLTARVAASVGTQHGWTFIYLHSPQMLAPALQVAAAYQPAVVFVEDIDDALENRDAMANQILNNLDGITSKDDEVMVVLTTNFLDRVDPALLRPGRMDTSIVMPTPDAPTVERMIRYYGPDLVIAEGPLKRVAQRLAGQIPAVIREVVERARLISMTKGSDSIRAVHLLEALGSMDDHMERLNREPKKDFSLEHRVGRAIKDLYIDAYREA